MIKALLFKKKIVERFLKKTPYTLSAFAFVNIFMWKDFFDFKFRTIDNMLCIFAKNEVGTFLYLPPLGPRLTAGVIDTCFDIMFKENKGRGVSRIENVEEKDLFLFPTDRYQIYKKSDEFVYARNEIASLKGNRYKSKRSAYNQFVRTHPHRFVAYDKKMQEACLSLYQKWSRDRKRAKSDNIYQQMIDDSQIAHLICLQDHKRLGLTGRVVFVGNRIVGYTFGFQLSENTFCVLLEITDLSIKGLPAYIFKEFCLDPEVVRFDLINVMDDFGIEDIRKTKLSFRPCQIHPCYVVARKDS